MSSDARPRSAIVPFPFRSAVLTAALAAHLALPLHAAAQETTWSDASELPSDIPDDAAVVIVAALTGTETAPESLLAVLDDGATSEIDLRDDGESPDAVAGDRVYTGAFDSATPGTLKISIGFAADRLFWTDSISVAEAEYPFRVAILKIAQRTQVALKPSRSDPGDFTPPPPPTPDNLPPSEGTQGVRPMGGGGGSAPLAIAVGLLALVVGAVFGLRLGRRRRVSLQPVGQPLPMPPPSQLPPLAELRQIWVLPDPQALQAATIALARRLARSGPVLLSSRPDQVEALALGLAGVLGVQRLPKDRPEPAKLLAAFRKLGGVLLVQGTEALEEPLQDESREAVLEELVTDASPQDSLLVLSLPGELDSLEPTLILGWGAAGLEDQDGRLILEGDPERLRLPPEPGA
jgi:hypothetical protein